MMFGAGLSCITEGNTSYSVASGTSFSAPHVAGVAAIFLSRALSQFVFLDPPASVAQYVQHPESFRIL